MYRHVGTTCWPATMRICGIEMANYQQSMSQEGETRPTLANAKRRENVRARKTGTERMHSASGHFENTRNALSFGMLSLVQHLGDSKQPPHRDATCVCMCVAPAARYEDRIRDVDG